MEEAQARARPIRDAEPLARAQLSRLVMMSYSARLKHSHFVYGAFEDVVAACQIVLYFGVRRPPEKSLHWTVWTVLGGRSSAGR